MMRIVLKVFEALGWVAGLITAILEPFIRLAVVIVMDYPAVVVQTWILVLHASWLNGLLLAVSLTLSLSARYAGTGGYLGRTNMWAKMFLSEHSNLDVLPLESYKHLLPAAYIDSLKRGFSWLRNPTKLTVCVVRPSHSGSLSAIVSFKSLSKTCYVFLPDHPQDFSTYEKFCFMREIDHVTSPSQVLDRRAQQSVWIWTLPWIALLADWRLQNAIALILMFIAYQVLFVSSEFGTETEADAIMREQMRADSVALSRLSEEERLRLDEILAEYPLRDPVAHDTATSSQPFLSQFFLPSYQTSLELSADFRNFALRQAIAESLRHRTALQAQAGAGSYTLPLEAIRVAIILMSGGAMAVLGQSNTPWRLWTAGALATFMLMSAIISWRHIFRTRRKIDASIAQYSISSA